MPCSQSLYSCTNVHLLLYVVKCLWFVLDVNSVHIWYIRNIRGGIMGLATMAMPHSTFRHAVCPLINLIVDFQGLKTMFYIRILNNLLRNCFNCKKCSRNASNPIATLPVFHTGNFGLRQSHLIHVLPSHFSKQSWFFFVQTVQITPPLCHVHVGTSNAVVFDPQTFPSNYVLPSTPRVGKLFGVEHRMSPQGTYCGPDFRTGKFYVKKLITVD